MVVPVAEDILDPPKDFRIVVFNTTKDIIYSVEWQLWLKQQEIIKSVNIYFCQNSQSSERCQVSIYCTIYRIDK